MKLCFLFLGRKISRLGVPRDDERVERRHAGSAIARVLEHVSERTEDLVHLDLLVRKYVAAIHGVDDHSGSGLEQQQTPIARLRAIDREVIKSDQLRNGPQRNAVPRGEIVVEPFHAEGLLRAPFRALRGDASDSCALKDELGILNRYVDVEQVRFDGKLAFHVDVPASLMDATVPSFLLQPLVENAIRHGRATSDGAAKLGVRAEQTDDGLTISVWDDGMMNAAASESSGGVGLKNVRERLLQLYGVERSFEIGRTPRRLSHESRSRSGSRAQRVDPG
ncbi:MAG: hypothetical protein ABI311_12375 [Gemmatimonadaceae bacterium]